MRSSHHQHSHNPISLPEPQVFLLKDPRLHSHLPHLSLFSPVPHHRELCEHAREGILEPTHVQGHTATTEEPRADRTPSALAASASAAALSTSPAGALLALSFPEGGAAGAEREAMHANKQEGSRQVRHPTPAPSRVKTKALVSHTHGNGLKLRREGASAGPTAAAAASSPGFPDLHLSVFEIGQAKNGLRARAAPQGRWRDSLLRISAALAVLEPGPR